MESPAAVPTYESALRELIFDLIEEYRAPFGDKVVIAMLGKGFIMHVDRQGRLSTDCRRKLAQAFWRNWKKTIQWRGTSSTGGQILDGQVASLKAMYLGKDTYRPFRFRW